MLTKIAAFDPETVSLLGAVLDQAIAALPPDGRSQERNDLTRLETSERGFHGRKRPRPSAGSRPCDGPLRDA